MQAIRTVVAICFAGACALAQATEDSLNRVFGSIAGNFDRSAGLVDTISEDVYSR